jgi:hypothetical protein
MIDMARDTFKLLIENKLFADPKVAFRQVGIGMAGSAIVLIALAFTPLPLWLAGIVAGFGGGYAMPYLFRDIKFR